MKEPITCSTITFLHGTSRAVTVPGAIGPSFHDLLSQTIGSSRDFPNGAMTSARLCQIPGNAALVRVRLEACPDAIGSSGEAR